MALSFLFQGSPTPSSVSTTTSTSGLPAWYETYLQGLLARSDAIAAQPYTPYDAQRIAPFQPLQNQAAGTAQASATAMQPWLQQGQQALSAGMAPAYQGAQNYMNPFQDQYLSQIGRLASRNLNENILPNVNSTFTGAGQFGSSRNAEFENRAIRDTQEGVSNAVGQQLYQGWNAANQLAGQDASRSLQAGQLAGSLGTAAQTGDIRATGALSMMGGQQQQQAQAPLDLAYQDFLRQQQYPFQQAGFMSNIIRGTAPAAGQQQAQTTTTPTGFQPSPLNQILGYSAILGGLGNMFNAKRGGLAHARARRVRPHRRR